MNPAKVEIVPMTEAHWPQVEAIYKDGIHTGQATFESQTPSWKKWDANHHIFGRLVAVKGEIVLGWAALSPVSSRHVYRGIAEESIYIHPEAKKQGLGTQLMKALIQDAKANQIWTIHGVMFPENEATVRLHEKCGFRLVGRRKKIAQQKGIWRDTVMYELSLVNG